MHEATWAQKRYGWGWRGPKSAPEIQTQASFDEYEIDGKTFVELLAVIEAKCLELGIDSSTATVSMETEYGSYGDRDKDLFTVSGWKLATAEEIRERESKITESRKYADAALAQAEATLRAAKPELFKD